MKRIDHLRVAAPLLAAALAFVVSNAHATPPINGVHITPRVFNDCPISVFSATNLYPGLVKLDDSPSGFCVGFANLHAWSFSSDGGASDAAFQNSDAFAFSSTMVLDGTDPNGEAGLRISPWWSPFADGHFNCRVPDGEIACFGGRLPFYSFTANYGVLYTRGTPARLEIIYLPNGLSSSSPATIQYNLTIGASNYTSGVLNFDQGNPAEDPPHGQWGILNPAWAGGYMLDQVGSGHDAELSASFFDILFQDLTPVPTQNTTWGKLKAIYR
jgi:hypothetical protein